MDSTLWYLLAFCGILLTAFALWALKFLFPRFRDTFVHLLKFPLLVKRGRFWDSVTRLEALCLACFILLNVFMIISPFETIDWRRIERRAAFASGINLIPVCLGSRMGPMMEAFNVHYSTYRLMHHWTGRMAIIDGLTHAVIVLALRPRLGSLVTSGWAALCGMAATLLLTFCVLRAMFSRWFLTTHRIATLSALGALFWHVLMQASLGPKLVVGTASSIWVAFTLYRSYGLFRHPLSAEIVDVCRGAGLVKIEVVLRRPTLIGPGNYFNIFFPGVVSPYALFHSFSCVAFWHPPDDGQPCRKLTNVSFLLSLSGRQASAIARLSKGQRILLEGPFGKNLKLQKYENVVLAAEGIGIAAVLPLVLELAERRRHDDNIRRQIQSIPRQLANIQNEAIGGILTLAQQETREEILARRKLLLKQPLFRDATKKIDVFWSLRDNIEMDVIQDQLRLLKSLDPENKLIVFWCGFPAHRTGAEPFDPSPFWLCLEPSATRDSFQSLIASKIQEERRKAHGAMVVITCGGTVFTGSTRSTVVRSVDGMAIEFVETEYRPRM